MMELDHPDVAYALKTGYPRWKQPQSYYCEECGTSLEDEQAYEDAGHDFLCKDCLLTLHEKNWW